MHLLPVRWKAISTCLEDSTLSFMRKRLCSSSTPWPTNGAPWLPCPLLGVLRFDPVSGAWSTLAPASANRKSCLSFVLGGCLYVAGGAAENKSSVQRYDVATDTWTAVADMLKGRWFFGAITVGSVGSAEEQDLFGLTNRQIASRL